MKTKWNLLLAIFVIMGLAGAGFNPAQAQGTIYYVFPGGADTNDCMSWANACALQTALISASSGSEIWVAAGTYMPTSDPTDRTATFQLKEGVAVYGGFAGTESSREERDPQANLTVLSGDLNSDDGENFANNGENSYHVVTGADGALLDGFTITAGNANFMGSGLHWSGGGMFNENSNPILRNVTFSSNSATYAGGMYNRNSDPTLTNVTFIGNTVMDYGGGMYNYNSNPILSNVTFSGNSAVYLGGGMFNSYSYPTLTNVTFSGNTAHWGGGMSNQHSSPTLINVTLNGNSATSYGGGLYNVYSNPILTNISFSSNSAISGGGMYNNASSLPVIQNTILWGDTGGEVVNFDTSSATITSSIVQGGCPTGATCTNVIDTDPHLGPMGNYGGSTDTIPLLPGSSAIDAGDDSLCSATDQRGVARPQGAGCDIGAFEYDYTGIYYVTPGGTGTQDGQNWTNASDLQNALKTARSGDELWVAAGVYKPTTDLTDRIATFQLKEGVAVYGGFAGTESSRDERDPQANLTVLSGDLNGDDGENFANNGENSYHVVTGADGAILDGVTITAGNADYPASSQDPLLRYAGAGMYNKNSNPILSNITFSGNIARAGGGMYNYTSSPTLSNITFSGNSAMYTGGGMFNYDSSNPTLNNITFSGNSAVYDGGGMYNLWSSSPTLTNVTFSGNSANNGGGMYNGTSYPVIRNSILWGNKGGEVICSEPSYATITSSIVQDGCPTGATCTNVIDTDPHLGTLGSYGGSTLTIPLLPGSSAIDAGDDSLCPTADQRGVARVGVCDIGAFEYDYTGIYYVAPGGTGTQDGQSWTNASDLQNALKTARSGDELWVAAGVYKPTTDLTDRIATFQLKEGVAVYGGFAGTETSREERDPQANLTVLSGDLNSDDGENFANNGENSYHVVTGADGALLDGVTITAGNANGTYPHGRGGGMYNESNSPSLNNTTFTGNVAVGFGGAVFNGGTLNVTNSTLSGNMNMGPYGGAINNGGTLNVTNTTFSGNVAKVGFGGAVFNGGTMTVMDSFFSSNEARGTNGYGGAIYNIRGSLNVTNTTFDANWAQIRGGAIYANSGTGTWFSSSTFIDNSAAVGGAIYAFAGAELTVANSTFSNNSATHSGGGLFNRGTATVTNSTFERSIIYNYNVLNPDTLLTVYNSIVAGPSDWDSLRCEGPISGSHNLADDNSCGPAFTSSPTILLGALGSFGGSTQTIPLLLGSSAIDMGDGSLCPTTDQRGVPRPQGAGCDIGAFEKELAAVALSDLEHIYDGSPKAATAATIPAGLVVDVTYNGSPELPINVGDYTVVATINDVQYMGSATATLTIQKRQVTVTADAIIRYSGQPDPELTYQITSGELADGDVFSGALSRTAGEAPGTYPILQGSLALSENYLLTYIGADFTILPAADLGITNTDSKDPIKPGDKLVYTLEVSNSGPHAAQSVIVVDNLDRDTVFVSASAPKGWACTFANGKVTCTSSSLAAGSTATIKVSVTVSKTVKIGKELVNAAEVSSDTHDLGPSNNSVLQKTLVVK